MAAWGVVLKCGILGLCVFSTNLQMIKYCHGRIFHRGMETGKQSQDVPSFTSQQLLSSNFRSLPYSYPSSLNGQGKLSTLEDNVLNLLLFEGHF